MSAVMWEVVREDDTGRVLSGFAVPPVPGDVIVLASPANNLDGHFRVRRRLIVGGLSKPKLIVVADA